MPSDVSVLEPMLLRAIQLKLHGMLGVPRGGDEISGASSETSSTGDPRSARIRRRHRKGHKLPLQYLNQTVQNTDEHFFENFTAIHWKLQAQKEVFMKPPNEAALTPAEEDHRRLSLKLGDISKLTPKEMDTLYVEVLYTILHRIGVEHGLPLSPEMIDYSQKAFKVALADHHQLLRRASVSNAKDLVAKDINGSSDPFCMMGIVPGRQVTGSSSPHSMADALAASTNSFLDTPPSPSPKTSPDEPCKDKERENSIAPSGGGFMNRRHTLIPGAPNNDQKFFGSFRRKKKVKQEENLPVKFIQATSVRKVTLNPTWNETFQFEIEDIQTDIFHLDIWDHDDEASVVDAVKKLNEVSNFQGFKRYFKQVAQSARTGSDESVDDFLGSIDVRLNDIPSKGIEEWYDLEAIKSSKSQVGGKIKLKAWLGARERRSSVMFDHPKPPELVQHEYIIRVFTEYELSRFNQEPSIWFGRFPKQARTILDQHALQGGLNTFQQSIARWVAFVKIHEETGLSYRLLLDRIHAVLDGYSSQDQNITPAEESTLCESFGQFTTVCLQTIFLHRTLLPSWQKSSADKLEYMLKCLVTLHNSELHAKCVPYKSDLSMEVTARMKVSAEQFFDSAKIAAQRKKEKGIYVYLASIINMLNAGMHESKNNYDHAFIKAQILDVDYLRTTFEQFDILLSVELGLTLCNNKDSILMHVFELYFSLSEFLSYANSMNPPMSPVKCALAGRSFEWAMHEWLELAKGKIMARIDAACQLDKKIDSNKGTTLQSTSYVDICYTLQQIIEFWDRLHVSGGMEGLQVTEKVVNLVCKACEYYTDKVFAFLAHAGFFDNVMPISQQIICQLCMTVNDAEQLRRVVRDLPDKLAFEQLITKLETEQGPTRAKQIKNSLEEQVDACDSSIGKQIELALAKLVDRKKNDLKKLIFHLAWSPSGCPVETAVQPLVDKLDAFLFDFHQWLLHRNFVRLLLAQLTEVVAEIRHTVDENKGKEPMFYSRLHDALQVLVEFFHAAGKGMTMQAVRDTKGYEALFQILADNENSTEDLIRDYYASLLKAQENATDCRHGILNVRAYYNSQANTLVVDVIGAKNIIPLDTNGLSDPFVIVELVPPTHFLTNSHQKSKICYKTLNPVWDETLEFALTCEPPAQALIHFIVLDYDFLMSNDFAGEALLQLQDVPGFAGHQPTTLRQFNLILIRDPQRDCRDRGPLRILDSRKEDKTAVDFIKHIVSIKKS